MFASRDTASKPGTFESVLGKGIEIKGTVKSKGSIRIDGITEGTIHSDSDVMIGETAVVNSDISAQNVIIAGKVSGNITCSGRVELLSTARLKGDIVTGTLVISEGAVFSGSSQMADPAQPATSGMQGTVGTRERDASARQAMSG
ncbi:MAG: polymer-forming cytoskeletal protein [Candidatus Fermentithermobacillus carboniphilus]|uniref:Polymer-forming cytoskeletal protein n=1 Tax=Candidatus Fermentithermobacillus carboniphilus TaxID=3085328 RepID=A0AAT9L9Y6_9FIRM|nr:MAG: polymer-forming cytoskeletal protein [Candidatus Fermentithermobacillus carboniphilus]